MIKIRIMSKYAGCGNLIISRNITNDVTYVNKLHIYIHRYKYRKTAHTHAHLTLHNSF